MTPSQLAVSTQDGATVISFTGEFDVADADRLRSLLINALGDSPCVVCDVSQATFFDSVTLGVLVLAAKTARKAGGWLRLAGPQRGTRRILRLTALDQILPIFESVGDAIVGQAQLQARSPADSSSGTALFGSKTRTG